MNIDKETILAISQTAAAAALEAVGATSGEISRSEALRRYGVYFRRAEAAGRIKPCRVGNGVSGTKWYSVVEILATRAADRANAEIQLKDSAA